MLLKKALPLVCKWVMIFLIVSLIAFFIPRLMPDNPAESMLDAHQMETTKENIEKLEEAWGLNKPLYVQYGTWMVNFLHGDWGKSLSTHLDIRDAFLKRLPYSLTIGLGGLTLSAICSFFLGFGAALKERGLFDLLTRILSLLSLSVPSFVTTVIIVYFIGVRFKLVKFFTGNSHWNLIIAILLIALYAVGPMARVVKAHFKEQMIAPYVTFAISRGFPLRTVLLRHTYKPVLCGLIAVLISRTPIVFGGSAILEFALGIPGINFFLVECMHATDYYVLQSYIIVMIICMFVIHVIFNLLLNLLDRREAL